MVPSLLCTFVAHITFLHVFFLPPPFILSPRSLSCFLSLSLYLCPLFLSVVARHMSSDALYQIFSSWSILLFHTISFHSSYKIHQLFTDYLLRLSSSELLEKHLFRSRANRRLVLVRAKGQNIVIYIDFVPLAWKKYFMQPAENCVLTSVFTRC